MNDRQQNRRAADEVTADFPANVANRRNVNDTSIDSQDLDETLQPQPSPAWPVPKQIGRYPIIQCLGKGGQGAVYRAIHPSLPIELAIKVCAHTLDAAAGETLNAEASILCELDHPHIARVRDLDFDQGHPFLVLDFIRGRSLEELLVSGEPSREQLVQWLSSIANAIDYAHRRGILHLDLKPANIVVDEKDAAKVIDFGMARMRGAWSDASSEADGISGTLSYMSPEQASGRARQIDSRSDIFALGAILYRILTGHAPFRGSTASETLECIRQCRFDRQSLDELNAPRHWLDACNKAMELDPAKRFASAKEFAQAITPPTDPDLPETRSRTKLSISFLGFTVTFAVACILLVVFSVKERSPSTTVAVNAPLPDAPSPDAPSPDAPSPVDQPPLQVEDRPVELQIGHLRMVEQAPDPALAQDAQHAQNDRSLLIQLRKTIGAETARTSLLNDLQSFIRTPTTDSWTRIQNRVAGDRDMLIGAIENLDQLDGPFIVNEMETYRQLRLDLEEKLRIYNRLVDLDAETAIGNKATVQEISDQLTALVMRVREHEAKLQQYLQTAP